MQVLIVVVSLIVVVVLLYSPIPSTTLRVINRVRIHISKPTEKYLCLTFDDGPSKEYTLKLLKLLREYNVKATFFVVADFALANPNIINQMKGDGHEIGLHSLCHKNAMKQGVKASKEDMLNALSIAKGLDLTVKYYRPPWGIVNLESLYQMKKHHLKMVLWSVMAGDWEGGITGQIIVNRLKRKVKNGSVICLHDGRGQNGAPGRTIEALTEMIPIWKSQGYEFIKVDELYEKGK